jgi:hypothetical protein
LRSLMLVSTELLIGVYFFNMLAGLDLNHNTRTLNTSGSISQSIYCYMTEYYDPALINLIQRVKIHARNQF